MKQLLLAGAAILWSASAHATVLEGTFSGAVQSGFDISNTFGTGLGTDLTGQPITGTFIFDSDAFQSSSVSQGGTALNVAGGPLFGGPIMAPPARVTETINGHSLTSVGGEGSSAFVNQNTPGPGTDTTTAFGIAVSVDLDNSFGTIVDYAKLNSPTTIISNIADIGTVSFTNIDGDIINGGGFPFGGEIFQGAGNAGDILFSVTDMSVLPVNIPEPGTLAVLGAGLIGLAAALQRKRS